MDSDVTHRKQNIQQQNNRYFFEKPSELDRLAGSPRMF